MSGDACWELRSGTNSRIYLVELGIFMAAATASTFGFGRPAVIGVTPTAPVVGQAHDTGDVAAIGATAVAWATKPTVPATAYLRRIGFPAAIGAGVIWTFDKPIAIPISSSLAIWNLATNGVVDIYAVWDE